VVNLNVAKAPGLYCAWAKSKVEAEMVNLNVVKAPGLVVGTDTVLQSSIVQSEGNMQFFW
jgi:hypothetical protein